MNLLARRGIDWLVAISAVCIGCSDGDGLELSPDVRQTTVEFIEFNLPTTNLYFDSLRTDEGASLLVGEYSDDIFGSVSATGYSEFSYSKGPLPFFRFDDDGTLLANNQNISFDSLSFDSMTISLQVSEVLTSSDLLVQSIEFFKLTDSLFSDVIYLAEREISLGESLGSDVHSFNPLAVSLLDLSVDTLLAKFKLDDSFGQEMFNRIARLDPNETNPFTAGSIRFPGIGFVSDGSTGIVRYELAHALSNLELHMSSPADSTYVIQFQFSNTSINDSKNFNHLDRDRSNAYFSTLKDRRALDVSTDFVYFNPIAGVLPRMDLSPYIEFVKQNEQSNIVIQRAQLSISGMPNENYIPEVRNAKFYFSSVDSTDASDIRFNINWAGLILDPFNTLLQTDLAYFQNFPFDVVAMVNSTTHNYSILPNNFFQNLLDQNKAGVDIYPDNLVMVSPVNHALGRSRIYKDSVRLKVFYVKFK